MKLRLSCDLVCLSNNYEGKRAAQLFIIHSIYLVIIIVIMVIIVKVMLIIVIVMVTII